MYAGRYCDMGRRELVTRFGLLGLVAILAACGSLRPVATVTSPLPTPSATAAPVPAPSQSFWDRNFREPPPGILDVTQVDSSLGWILGAQCGASNPSVASSTRTFSGGCQYSVQPVDSAHPWPPAFTAKVGPVFSAADPGAPRFVHFLNRTDGFVYGRAAAFVTHDGGRTWSPAGLPTFDLVSITGVEKTAWAVTRDCASAATCPFGLRMSTDAGRTWSDPHALPGTFSPLGAIAYGSVGVVARDRRDLVITSDGGTSWRQIPGKCTSDSALRQVAATPDGRQLWQLCTTFPPQDDYNARLYLSEDGGLSWSRRGDDRLVFGAMLIMAAPGVGSVAMTSNGQQLMVTHNGGQTWIGSLVTFPPSNAYHLDQQRAISFGTSKDGLAFDVFGKVWATHDGGDTWADTHVSLSIPYADQP